MGIKGAKQERDSQNRREKRSEGGQHAAIEALAPLGEVTGRGVFGGFGIFKSGVMFALLNPKGRLCLRADESNADRFEPRARQGSLPYYEVPRAVAEDEEELLAWAARSVEIAEKTSKKKADEPAADASETPKTAEKAAAKPVGASAEKKKAAGKTAKKKTAATAKKKTASKKTAKKKTANKKPS